jgi:hypothetical protein
MSSCAHAEEEGATGEKNGKELPASHVILNAQVSMLILCGQQLKIGMISAIGIHLGARKER